MGDSYFVLWRCEDDLHAGSFSKAQLEGHMNNEDGYFRELKSLAGVPELDAFPARSMLVIKGAIVVPRETQVVVRREVP